MALEIQLLGDPGSPTREWGEIQRRIVLRHVDLLKTELAKYLKEKQLGSGGGGMLGQPRMVSHTAATLRASWGEGVPVTNQILEYCKSHMGEGLLEGWFALYMIDWPDLATFLHFAQFYMAQRKWSEWRTNMLEDLTELGLV